MALRWFSLFLGLIALQGYLAFSPLPEENWDEEWATFAQTMSDPAYRLPNSTTPSRYEVTLSPYLTTVPASVQNASPFTFDGTVAITIRATQQNVNEIVLHCNDLTISSLTVSLASTPATNIAVNQAYQCQMPWSFLRIPLTTTLQINQDYIISSTFKGILQTNMRGFYRSWYIDQSGQRRWMATTQFQPGHARQAFPCYDEPGFKAFFDITIVRESDFSPTLGNMPIRSNATLSDGRISETFYTTTLTSTYLLAFIVSHYTVVASGTDPLRPFYIYARNNVVDEGDWSLEIGEKLLVAMENYTGYPYYTMANNIIMQQAAIPDFSAGAMENWGLLTYREALILYDPLKSNHFYKQRVANIVSHEVAHMWFGNLVTCAWWDNLWLNEGFARYYQYYLTARVAPDLGYETRFIVEQLHVSLLSDSVDSAHALTNPAVNDPTSVSAHFSQITYGKGACVLRMTQHLLSDSTYEKALRNYIRQNAFDVAEPDDLFTALDGAAAEDNALTDYGSITVRDYIRTWSEQGGHPLLTVAVDHDTGRMTVTQRRFNVNTGVSEIPSVWLIPLTWTRAGAVDFDNLKPSQIMSAEPIIIERVTRGREWVIFNKQQSGFYRVNYDTVTWSLITQALRDNSRRNQIHEYNRAQIVDDVFIMARAGLLSYTRAFNILSFLEFEDQYAPWIAAIAGFNFSRRRLAHNATLLAELESNIHTLSRAVTARLGFSERPNESYMDGLLRMYVNTFLCNIGHAECVEAGRTNFANWRQNNAYIPPNMRPWVYCTGLRYGTAEDFTFFWTQYLQEDLASEQVVMLTAAGCTRDQNSLGIFLNAITAGSNDYTIRDQDYSTALNSALTSNEENTLVAFEWLQQNFQRTAAALGSINSPLSTITSRLLNEQQITEVSNWLQVNQALIGQSAYNSGMNGINSARNNIQWYNRRVSEYQSYFETGYVDDLLEDSTTSSTSTTTQAPTTVPTTPPDGNGASRIQPILLFLVPLGCLCKYIML
ncbi:unnamed protein product [Arctia plantaginis]|uniref:Aminopeptidase n=1 Tax=Arctia plantaginis TaxID=874455 RepID=A0A8S1A1G2_ARCPL|nr:unnamed protein product [Arctia plantaginis]CAB3239513.1 unnamed protein product [Arctia plantaginis]